MHDVYLGLGSNLGDREAMLRAALVAIHDLPTTTLVKQSPIYETPPMGPQDQDAYLNMAAWITTSLDARELMKALQQIESQLGRAGREQRQHWGPRQIDIDILLYGNEVIDESGLTVPHPGMHDRWFVLKPLSDLAPHVEHPILGKRIDALLDLLDRVRAKEVSP
ncbi:MAG: 2-amino-4-hydroxy-6-hydroxymethyldihydropteridine diphosphokinase [Phycisphaeraceae bacterium]